MCPAPDRQVFQDAACALSTRAALDGLALEVLAAPGLAAAEAGSLVRFASEGQLDRGQQALERLRSAVEEGGS